MSTTDEPIEHHIGASREPGSDTWRVSCSCGEGFEIDDATINGRYLDAIRSLHRAAVSDIRIRQQAEIAQAAATLAATVEPHTLPLYLTELERRWEFALEAARTTVRDVRPDMGALVRSMVAEIAGGVL